MQYGTDGLTWTEWLEANDDRDDATKLAALREYITDAASRAFGRGDIGAEWANKKLAKLGIPQRMLADSSYVVSAPVSATLRYFAAAGSRADALEQFKSYVDNLGGSSASVTGVAVTGTPVFVSGPEDPEDVVSDDAPTTVEGTLEMLREVILYGYIAGPRYCEDGANRVLESFGLAPIPPRKRFVVERLAEAVMRTTVEAYDEASAERVAGWRWENGQTGYEAKVVNELGEGVATLA